MDNYFAREVKFENGSAVWEGHECIIFPEKYADAETDTADTCFRMSHFAGPRAEPRRGEEGDHLEPEPRAAEGDALRQRRLHLHRPQRRGRRREQPLQPRHQM